MTDRLAGYLAVLGLSENPGARLAAGQFHDVVLAAEVAYRFPRNEDSRRKLPAACELLATLGDCGLPAAIPRLLDTSHLDRPLVRSHAAVSLLPGAPLAAGLSQHAQEAAANQLAGLLDQLAAAASDERLLRLVPGAPRWVDFAASVRQVLFPLMSAEGRRRAEAELAAACELAPGGHALVHTDLGGNNLLWSSDGDGLPRLTGVLDWDGAVIGNQASDLASIAVTVGWPLAERIDDLRRAGPPLMAEARVVAATFALQQALPAALGKDKPNLDDGLTGYR
ncbi:MAG TPA: aminoglycoside phosphotransferase family protein [Streptosporangiaceae bacterium]|nr:aminoglycoside phosphotransferase family protein [Streptosporangiaceae bacterium]